MSATNNLSSPQFYHGSRAKFSVGDMITTPNEHGGGTNYQTSSKAHTYMTDNLDAAKGFARRIRGTDAYVPESDQGTVYRVEATAKHTRDPDSLEGSKGGQRRSKGPLRVTGIET
jgi:Rifampin ADP-ribosyl transferase